MDGYSMSDEERAILSACLDQKETVPTKKLEDVFERALTQDADSFARFFETRVKSRSAFSTLLNVPVNFPQGD